MPEEKIPQPENSEVPQPVAKETPAIPKKKKFSNTTWLVISLVLLIILGTSGYFLLASKSTNQQNSSKTSVNSSQASLSVNWFSPQKTESLDLLTSDNLTSSKPENAEYYKVGKINNGKYKDSEIILLIYNSLENPWAYRFIENADGHLILLTRYSSPCITTGNIEGNISTFYDSCGLKKTLIGTRITFDSDSRLKELDLPAQIKGLGKGQELVENYPTLPERKETSNGFYAPPDTLFRPDGLKTAFIDSIWGSVYIKQDPYQPTGKEALLDLFMQNGFYIKLADGTTADYKLPNNQISENQITWIDGSKNQGSYTSMDFNAGGPINFVSVAPDNLMDSLAVIGKTSDGNDVYEIKNSNNSYLSNFYQLYKINSTDKNYQPTNLSKDVIDKLHPAIFIKDPFGRLLRYQFSVSNDTQVIQFVVTHQ